MGDASTARVRALAAAAAAALLCSGCFVLDELEDGQKRMEQDSPGGRSRRAPEPDAAKEEPGYLERAQRALGSVSGAVGDLAGGLMGGDPGSGEPAREPAERMIRCEIDGSLLFTRRTDCRARGGRVAGEIRALDPDA